MSRQPEAFTLLEIMAVLVIIGILATIALPNFTRMKERALDNEAKANLKLIQAAERIYRMEYGVYLACVDEAEINTNLKLSLPGGNNRIWEYSTTGDATSLIADAIRHNAPAGWARTFRIDQDDEEASCIDGTCS